MYTFSRTNLPHKTIELSLTFPWADIQKEYDVSFEKLREETTIEGFRKGKAPADVAKKHIKKESVYDHLIRTILQNAYEEIIKKEQFAPVIPPKIDLTSAKENEEWKFTITTAEAPDLKLGDYKAKIKDAKKNLKKDDIWTPNKEGKETNVESEEKKRAAFQAALDALLRSSTLEISDLIIQEELDRRLSKLIDDVARVGLTIESYLASKNLTKDKLQENLKKEIIDTYTLELALQKIAEEEKIQIEDAEIKSFLSGLKNEKDKETAQKNMYYYASLLRKQKVLDYIDSL